MLGTQSSATATGQSSRLIYIKGIDDSGQPQRPGAPDFGRQRRTRKRPAEARLERRRAPLPRRDGVPGEFAGCRDNRSEGGQCRAR
jgi:hypothetical protein